MYIHFLGSGGSTELSAGWSDETSGSALSPSRIDATAVPADCGLGRRRSLSKSRVPGADQRGRSLVEHDLPCLVGQGVVERHDAVPRPGARRPCFEDRSGEDEHVTDPGRRRETVLRTHQATMSWSGPV